MLRWLWLSGLMIGLDQLTKWWAETTLNLYEPVPILPFFNLTLMYNTGAAFSFLAGAGGWQRWFFLVVSLIISIILVVWISRLREGEGRLALALALILGGAVGNLGDRELHGYVVDFLDFYDGQWHWPAFNVADSAITVGAILLILDSLLRARQTPETDDAR
jgi:signal peptidase II